MSVNENHIINKEIFEFTYSQIEYAFELQKQMEAGLQFNINAGISGVLNECNDEEETIRIEKIEIDLGEIYYQHMNELLPAKLYTQLKEKITSSTFRKKIISGVEQQSTVYDNIELLEIFLLSGTLPWWAGSPKQFSFTEIFNSLIKNNEVELRELFLRHITDERFIKRLFYQTAQGPQTALDLCGQLFSLLHISSQQISLIENIIRSSIIPVPQDQPSFDFQKLSASIISFPQDQYQIYLSKNILRIVIKLIINHSSPLSEEELKFFLKQEIIKLFENSIEINRLEESIKTLDIKKFHSEIELVKNEISKKKKFENLPSDKESLIKKDEKIFIQNSGLILFSTFFPALFNELHFINDGKFINKEMQVKALFLLYYLSTGLSEAPEYTLQLNKILCGLDIEEPIPFSVELTALEKQEAEQLLQDIIIHWNVLKNSSVEALQGSFIMRDGLLSNVNEHWLLQVDRKGYDVLLDHIPWSWKTIKFNWMNTYIEVEW